MFTRRSNLEFEKFVSILYSIFAGGMKADAFTKELFLNIVEPEDCIDSYTLPSFKSYFSGVNGISGIAKKINKNIDVVKFITFLDNLPDGAAQNLAKELSAYKPDITEFNVSSECADILQNIIIEASKSHRKKSNGKADIPEIKTEQIDNGTKDLNIRLAIETKGKCPNDNCNKPLYVRNAEKTTENFTVTVIDPSESKDSYANLIALCHDCYKRYLLSQNDASIMRMKEIKQMLAEEELVGETVAQLPIETGVERLLRKIADGSSVPAITLVMDPVRVDEKITTDRALLLKVTSYVNGYYTEVHEICKALDKEGILKFNSFCRKIKYSYETLEDLNLKQMEIFQRMVDWLSSTTNEESLYCEIVISYFIQKCEVFHAVTE